MSPRVAALVLTLGAVGLAACGGETPIPDTEMRILVEPEALEVETGRPFRLRVTRSWSRDLEPAPWDDAALSPLVTRLASTSRREDAKHHEETFLYRAYAFALEDVKVPAVVFAARPKAGGNPRVVTAPALAFCVTPALDPEAPGEPELFGAMRPEPTPWKPWAVGLGLLLLGGAVWRLRRSAEAGGDGPVEPPPATPYERAAARLAGVDGDVVEAAEILRSYVYESLGVRTRERTTEEVVEASGVEGLSAEARASLGAVLGVADLVKFAAHEPSAPEGLGLVQRARDFVERTGRAAS